MSIEDRNYYNDSRVRLRDPRHTGWRLDESREVAIVPRVCAEHGTDGYDPETEPECAACVRLECRETPEEQEAREEAEKEGNARIAAPTEIEIPFAWVVCGQCRGNGMHVNPAVDCGGLTSEDFAADPDFAESYFSGVYDVTCGECQGRRVVPELRPRTAEQKAALGALDAQEEADVSYERERRHELAMGY